MFRKAPRPRSKAAAALELGEIIYHTTVRSVRGGGSNAILELLLTIAQTILMIVILYVTMKLMGMAGNGFRGDFVLFLTSGVMSYMTYKKTMGAVFGVGGPSSATMLHATMNTAVSIISGALAALYTQTLMVAVILFGYHCVFAPVVINDPVFAFGMLLQAWLFGIGTGMVLLAIKPWAPKLAPMLMMIISRANIFASGKMMVGNVLSFTLLAMFAWNPLFHIIDQMRGAMFINYIPRNSSVTYPLWFSLALIMVGLMGEFFTRQHVSRSWSARS